MELTDYEKAGIINTHIRNCVTAIFNINLEIISENAVSQPNQDTLDTLNIELVKQNARKSALIAEYEKLDLGE